jgi:hypothetical protein
MLDSFAYGSISPEVSDETGSGSQRLFFRANWLHGR